MKTMRRNAMAAAAVALVLGGCADLSTRDKNTALGAGIGGVAGAILTNGNPVGAVGGAALGGYIGNQVGTGKK
jgi:osmotically inducible lipoprotein OsmB